jgi:pimeloyl-ACP methyl ester carboxylesterase
MTTPKTQRVTVNGISIAYHEWSNEGEPLLCIPHITGHKGSFAPLAARLSSKYRVLALDLRGRCESDKPADGYGFAYHARDIITFADSLGIKTFSLVGHSFGATTSVYTASLHPKRIHSLVLLDGGADPKAETLRAMYPTIKRLNKVYASMQEYVAAQRSAPYHKPWSSMLEQYFRDDVEALEDGTVIAQSKAEPIERDLDLHFWSNVWFHLPHLNCPVLFLRPTEGLMGTAGHVYSDQEASKLVGLIPDCR